MTAQPHRPAMQQSTLTSGATARQLAATAPWRPSTASDASGASGASSHRRTPLSVVPAPLPKTGRGFIALCALMLVAALGVVLAVNITVSNRQYDLVTLRAEQTALSQANERLTQQAEHLAAPQNLAAQAASLGMVMPGDVAAIDLESGAVTGMATAAQEDDKPTDFVAAPSVPHRAPAAAQAPEGTSGAEEGSAAPDQKAGADAPATEKPTFSEAELNGGSIPAPQVQVPGR